MTSFSVTATATATATAGPVSLLSPCRRRPQQAQPTQQHYARYIHDPRLYDRTTRQRLQFLIRRGTVLTIIFIVAIIAITTTTATVTNTMSQLSSCSFLLSPSSSSSSSTTVMAFSAAPVIRSKPTATSTTTTSSIPLHGSTHFNSFSKLYSSSKESSFNDTRVTTTTTPLPSTTSSSASFSASSTSTGSVISYIEEEETKPNEHDDNHDDDIILQSKSLRRTLNVVDNPVMSDDDSTTTTIPWIVGHRGCLYEQLENTREGFIQCAKMGCDAVELDVFRLKCQTLVVFHGGGDDEHPGDLTEYCGISRNIVDYTYEETQQLQFNPLFEEFPCPDDIILKGTIPTLEQVLMDAKRSGIHVKIELKGENTVEGVLDLVDSLDMVDQTSFSSFDMDKLALVRKLRPTGGRSKYVTGALFNDLSSDFIQQAQAVGADEVHLRYDTCTVDIIDQIHRHGMGSMAWFRGPIGMKEDCNEKYWDVGNEDFDMYETLLRTGVQQMCVNRPDVLIKLKQQLLNKMNKEEKDLMIVSQPIAQSA